MMSVIIIIGYLFREAVTGCSDREQSSAFEL